MLSTHRRAVRLCLALLVPILAGCEQDQGISGEIGKPQCLELAVTSNSVEGRSRDSLGVVPTETFLVRLDTSSAGAGATDAFRLGMLGDEGGGPNMRPGTWSRPSPDRISIRWWDGRNGLGVEFMPSGEQWSGTGFVFDDRDCPGPDHCWTGNVSAVPEACPEGAWFQMEEWRWVPWKDVDES